MLFGKIQKRNLFMINDIMAKIKLYIYQFQFQYINKNYGFIIL